MDIAEVAKRSGLRASTLRYYEDLSDTRRASIESALLRYCELDTLAMVMAIQAWDHMAATSSRT